MSTNMTSITLSDDTNVVFKENINTTAQSVFHIVTTTGTWDRYFNVSYTIVDNYGVTLSTAPAQQLKAGTAYTLNYSYDTAHYENPSIAVGSVFIIEQDSNFTIRVNRKYFTVSYNANDGNGTGLPADTSVEYLSTIIIADDIIRNSDATYNYSFEYWEAGGEHLKSGDSVTIYGNLNIVARYYRTEKENWHRLQLTNNSWDAYPENTGPNYTTVYASVSKTNSNIKAANTKFYTGTDGKGFLNGDANLGNTTSFTMNASGNVLDGSSAVYSARGYWGGYQNKGNMFGYSLTASNGRITFEVWANTIQDENKVFGNEPTQKFYLTSGHITLNAIEQYYAKTDNNKIV